MLELSRISQEGFCPALGWLDIGFDHSPDREGESFDLSKQDHAGGEELGPVKAGPGNEELKPPQTGPGTRMLTIPSRGQVCEELGAS
jgi:hypothetical protein